MKRNLVRGATLSPSDGGSIRQNQSGVERETVLREKGGGRSRLRPCRFSAVWDPGCSERPRRAAIRRRAGSGDGARRLRERRASGRVKAAGLVVERGGCARARD